MPGDDPRLGEIITAGTDGDVVLLGFPFDAGMEAGHGFSPTNYLRIFIWIGVRINKGRPGAANGPAEVRVYAGFRVCAC
jgi:hypothetical protein